MSRPKFVVRRSPLASLSRRLASGSSSLRKLLERIGPTPKAAPSGGELEHRLKRISLSIEDAAMRRYAGALSVNVRGRPGAEAKATVSDVFDARDLPKFLNTSARSDPSANAAEGARAEPPRARRAVSHIGASARALRPKFQRARRSSKFAFGARLYLTAFAGFIVLVWGCASLVLTARQAAQSQRSTSNQQRVAPSGPAGLLASAEVEDRLNFAPGFASRERLEAATASPGSSEPAAASAKPPIAAPPTKEVEVATPPAVSPPKPQPAQRGYVIVRNLPTGISPPSGTRLSVNNWALSHSDVGELVVALAKTSEKPFTAEFEVFNSQGVSTGASRIEIRQAGVDIVVPAVKRSPPVPAAEKPLRRRNANRRAAKPPANAPTTAAAAAQTPAPQKPPAAPAPAPAPAPAQSVTQAPPWPPTISLFPQAAFPPDPQPGFSFGQ